MKNKNIFILSIFIAFYTIVFLSCLKEKLNFVSVLNDLKVSNITEKLRNYEYFGPFRNGYAMAIDSVTITFNMDKKDFSCDTNTIEIYVGSKADSTPERINHFKNSINLLIKVCKEHNIMGFATDSNIISYFLDIDNFDKKTLPEYYSKRIENPNAGVLVNQFNDNYNMEIIIMSKEALKLSDKWYYYEAVFLTK